MEIILLQKTAEVSSEDLKLHKDENDFKIFSHWICQPNLRPLMPENCTKKEIVEPNNILVTSQHEQDNGVNNQSAQFIVSSLFAEPSL
jgi:hypothetical protein